MDDEQRASFVRRIDAAHLVLIDIARDFRAAKDLDRAEDMSSAALLCRAARNDLRYPAPMKMCPECKACGGPDGVTNCATCRGGFWETTQSDAAGDSK